MLKNLETIHNVVIGTAGHIDHGKTTLVEKLTGINPDRLPEEKERGMTIDLGFSRFALPSGQRVGIVDVPGHERFVKNMVAGATGIDAVLLVVAADDGVMPQTREHLEIMGLLDLRHGLIALTKIDLVDRDLRDLVVEDVRQTVKGTFLEKASIVPVSSATGEGINGLRAELSRLASSIEPREATGVFRMPIQRVFSAKGFGTVVTGIPVSGRAAIGDTLEVVPLGATGRVRGIHAYGEATDLSRAGHSSALNLSDLDYKEVHRGMVLAQPDYFQATSMVEARFHHLKRALRPLQHLSEIRFHTGTAEILGRIHLLEQKTLAPGESALVQFRLEEPVVVAPGDRFVARLHSPMETLGGGEVLDSSRHRLKSGKSFVIEGLLKKEEALSSRRLQIVNALSAGGFTVVSEKDVAMASGMSQEEARTLVAELAAESTLVPSSRGGLWMLRARFDEAIARSRKEAESFFAKNPRRLLMERVHLRGALKAHDAFFQDLLAALDRDGIARTVRGEFLEWTGHKPRLSPKEQSARDELVKALGASPLMPPSPREAAQARGIDDATARAVTELLVEEGEIVKIAEDVYFHRDALEEARRRLRQLLEKEGSMTASSAKTVLASSRKYVIPLLEHFDREGFTMRHGDVRQLRG